MTAFKVSVEIPNIDAELNEEAVTVWLGRLGNASRNEAVRGIMRGSKSGRTYRRGGVSHRASAPGQYPASDTGLLANSFNITASGLRMSFGNAAPYAPFLEFGTSKMAPRKLVEDSFDSAYEKIEVPDNLIKIITR